MQIFPCNGAAIRRIVHSRQWKPCIYIGFASDFIDLLVVKQTVAIPFEDCQNRKLKPVINLFVAQVASRQLVLVLVGFTTRKHSKSFKIDL